MVPFRHCPKHAQLISAIKEEQRSRSLPPLDPPTEMLNRDSVHRRDLITVKQVEQRRYTGRSQIQHSAQSQRSSSDKQQSQSEQVLKLHSAVETKKLTIESDYCPVRRVLPSMKHLLTQKVINYTSLKSPLLRSDQRAASRLEIHKKLQSPPKPRTDKKIVLFERI